jgi:membrane fusion protein (multidrug efflux system)
MCACGLAALGLAVGGWVASHKAHAQSAPNNPGANQEPRKTTKPEFSRDAREAEVEALKKEIEVLRKKLEALGKKEEPRQEHAKIVVASPQARDVSITERYVCLLHSHRHIKVRPLLHGYLEAVPVKEGQTVKRGDVLFRILPTLYQPKLDAELAEVRVAQLELNNTKKAFSDKLVSQTEVALYEAKLAKIQARAKLAEAELRFTTILAPFDGILGRLQAQEGSLVTEGDTLTTLSDNSVVCGYFNVPEARYLDYMANRNQVKDDLPVELVLANGSRLPQPGKIAAIDADFGNGTGTIGFRADFPNPGGLLRHGQTGNVLIHRTFKNAIFIPQHAVFEVLAKRYVYVVGKDEVAHQREIVIQHELDDVFVIKKGLDVNDRVVVDGIRQVRDGEKVEYEIRKP